MNNGFTIEYMIMLLIVIFLTISLIMIVGLNDKNTEYVLPYTCRENYIYTVKSYQRFAIPPFQNRYNSFTLYLDLDGKPYTCERFEQEFPDKVKSK